MKCQVMWMFSIILVMVVVQCSTKRILFVPSMLASHIIEQAAVCEGLLKSGHEVYSTMSTAFPKGEKLLHPGVKALHFQTAADVKPIDAYLLRIFELDTFSSMMLVSGGVSKHCEAAMADERFRKQIDDLQFDLAVVDGFIMNYCNLLLPYVHGIPMVFMFSYVHPWTTGTPALPSFVSAGRAGGGFYASDNMDFFKRLQNLMWTVMLTDFTPFPGRTDLSLLHKYAPGVTTWEDLSYKCVLYVSTRDHLLEWPAPAMPNLLHTSGVTTKSAKPLPKHINDIINSTNKSVILVSFGSLASNFPDEITDKLIETFNHFEETIIWKFSGKSIDRVRSKLNANIHVFDWLPQNDLLGHPRTKVFVTHCGNNGQYEAVYHAVPMVGLPLFGEQHSNAFRIHEHGFGLSLLPDDLLTFDVPQLVAAIREVLTEPQYKVNIQKRSEILRDQPMTPVESIVYWLEHVMKHGSDHLRSRGMDLPWYQFWMLDILLLMVICLVLIVCCVWMVVKCICKCVWKQKSKKE